MTLMSDSPSVARLLSGLLGDLLGLLGRLRLRCPLRGAALRGVLGDMLGGVLDDMLRGVLGSMLCGVFGNGLGGMLCGVFGNWLGGMLACRGPKSCPLVGRRDGLDGHGAHRRVGCDYHD